MALNMDVDMPPVESIRRLVQRNEGVAFLPGMARRALSHAARAFLELVKSNPLGG